MLKKDFIVNFNRWFKMLHLKHIEGRTYEPSLQPEKIFLKPTVTRFGRCNESSDVVIDSSISPLMISRLHAEIRFVDGKYRIDCKGMNGMIVNRKKRSSAVLCEGDEIVFGGVGVKKKVKEGQIVRSYDSELVYFFKEIRPSSSEEPDSLGEGTSDGKVRRRSKRKQPVSTSEELLLRYQVFSAFHYFPLYCGNGTFPPVPLLFLLSSWPSL